MKKSKGNNTYKIPSGENIGLRVAELRTQYGLTQGDLAKKLNTKQQVVSRIEKTNYMPNTSTLQKIAKIFNKKLKIDFE